MLITRPIALADWSSAVGLIAYRHTDIKLQIPKDLLVKAFHCVGSTS